MADNTPTPIADGTVIATDEANGAHYQRVKPAFGVDGQAVDVSASNPLPVTIGSGPFAVTGQFYQTTQPVSGTVSVSNLPATQPVSGNVGVTGSVAVTGPLTDSQLRATAVPVSGTFWQATQPVSGTVGISGSVAVTGTFYQATQPISAASLPLPAGAATRAIQTTGNTALSTLLTETTFTARHPTTGPKAASGSVPIVIANDQDPVLDHANGVKANVTTSSSTAITPPAGARYLRVMATADMFIRTDGSAAADAAGSTPLKAGVIETIPCVGSTAVTAIVATGTGTLYATPSKSRT